MTREFLKDVVPADICRYVGIIKRKDVTRGRGYNCDHDAWRENEEDLTLPWYFHVEEV